MQNFSFFIVKISRSRLLPAKIISKADFSKNHLKWRSEMFWVFCSKLIINLFFRFSLNDTFCCWTWKHLVVQIDFRERPFRMFAKWITLSCITSQPPEFWCLFVNKWIWKEKKSNFCAQSPKKRDFSQKENCSVSDQRKENFPYKIDDCFAWVFVSAKFSLMEKNRSLDNFSQADCYHLRS